MGNSEAKGTGSASLSAFGFTSKGVASGSRAAKIHSKIGNVSSRSTFSIFQSLGAKGSGKKNKK